MECTIHGCDGPALIYLPGLHGDWTLITGFRRAVAGQARLVELTYPRTVSWTLADHASAARDCLAAHGIQRGWLVGESFGSQVVWAMLQQAQEPALAVGNAFTPQGVILAGGFVRHPWLGGVCLARRLCESAPPWSLRAFLPAYPYYARLRMGGHPESRATLEQFIRRRQEPGDREAMTHRLKLIATADFRNIATQAQLPVFFLTGLWYPIVPWPPVRAWLRQRCPGFRGSRVLPWGDHTVLTSQPEASARIVLNWLTKAQP